MNENLMGLSIVVVVASAFLVGLIVGNQSMAELKRNGYEVIKHEVRHGNFSTN